MSTRDPDFEDWLENVRGVCADLDCGAKAGYTYLSPAARKIGMEPLPVCDEHAERVRKMEAHMRANGYPDVDYSVKPMGA